MGRKSTGTVEPRQSCIRLKFTHLGVRRVETLDLAPTPANIKAAQRLMARVQGAIEAGCYRRGDYFATADRQASPETFKEYAEAWGNTLATEQSTKRSYLGAVKATWTPAFGDVPIGQIRFSDIKKAIAAKRDAGVSGKTINNALIALRQVFDMAKQDGLIPTNPAEGIKNLRHQKPEPDPLSRDETAAVLAHIQAKYPEQVWNYFDFAFNTGLRPSEEIVLRWPDIDWNRKTARIERAFVEGVEKDTKTHRSRDVDLSDAAIAALQRQKKFTFMASPDGEIFRNPVTAEAWNSPQKQRINYWAPTLRALGMRGRDAYQTRHTFATTLLMGGVNPAYIAKQLGHTSAKMLFEVYGRWIEGADKGAEARKANALLGCAGQPPAGTQTGTNNGN